MEAQKIDIVLSDICMPQMSGLDLYDVILEKWPHSKMIFLTGHLEFDFVYKVHKHARYVLKAEEDEKIVEAVKESIEEIENDLLLERMTLDRSKHQHRNKYYERLLLLKELVEGSISSSLVTQEMMDQMGAELNLSEHMYCVLIRCTAIQRLEYPQQAQAGESLGLLMDKLYLNNWRGTFFGYNKYLIPRTRLSAASWRQQSPEAYSPFPAWAPPSSILPATIRKTTGWVPTRFFPSGRCGKSICGALKSQ